MQLEIIADSSNRESVDRLMR